MPILTVEVFRGGELIDRRERPLRRTPDGRIGVAFEGAVFPVVDRRRVDVEGRWFYPSECPILMEPPAEWEDGAGRDLPFRWDYDASGYYAYLFLDGDEGFRRAAVDALQSAGFPVSRSGPSFREAPTGDYYKWYVRLATESEAKPSRWEIAEALSSVPTPRAVPEAASSRESAVPEVRLDRALAQVREWEERVARAELLATKREDELAAAQAELRQLSQSAARENAKLIDQATILHAALHEFRSRIEGLSDRERDIVAELERLTRELAAARELVNEEVHAASCARADRDQAIAEWTEAEEIRRSNERELAEAVGRLEDLQAELARAREAASGFSAKGNDRSRKGRREELSITLAALLPGINFVGGSIDFAAEEVFDRRDLFIDLRALHDAPESLPSKKVGGTQRWLERHFSTGRSNDGRIYFRKRSDGIYDVLISDKAAQPRDIERLKSL